MKTTTVEITAIREFLNSWKKEVYEFYLNQLEAMKAEWEKLSKFDWQGHNALRKKYGVLVYNARTYGDSGAKYLEKEIEQDAEAKYNNMVAKIQGICGEVTKANLYIGRNGELNGYVYGTEGNAEVRTIGAGGYNVQRFHFRTLVKKF